MVVLWRDGLHAGGNATKPTSSPSACRPYCQNFPRTHSLSRTSLLEARFHPVDVVNHHRCIGEVVFQIFDQVQAWNLCVQECEWLGDAHADFKNRQVHPRSHHADA
mmetsp:Transcript_115024/g.223462  ORF Transcript_115024/g.223462 Transcript_115024/m.223462 type:complete len:106 (-) Transcript_115024:1134-1451(-)